MNWGSGGGSQHKMHTLPSGRTEVQVPGLPPAGEQVLRVSFTPTPPLCLYLYGGQEKAARNGGAVQVLSSNYSPCGKNKEMKQNVSFKEMKQNVCWVVNELYFNKSATKKRGVGMFWGPEVAHWTGAMPSNEHGLVKTPAEH